MNQANIKVVDIFHFHAGIAVGLHAEGWQQCPLVVGCSIRSSKGQVLDIPAKVLKSSGLALWYLDAPVECKIQESDSSVFSGWVGEIIFALWADFSFTERLADTGWVQWSTPWLIGSSLDSLRVQEDEIERKYRHRKNVLTERFGNET